MAPLTSRTRRIIAGGCGLALVVGAAGGFLGRHLATVRQQLRGSDIFFAAAKS